MVNELYEFLMQELLPHRFPIVFRLNSSAGVLENLITNEKLFLRAPTDRYETLRKINRNVDEDFIMMLPSLDGDGYSLQAFVWAYPVIFDPQSLLGLKLRDLHKPVPGFKEKFMLSMDRYCNNRSLGTSNAASIGPWLSKTTSANEENNICTWDRSQRRRKSSWRAPCASRDADLVRVAKER